MYIQRQLCNKKWVTLTPQFESLAAAKNFAAAHYFARYRVVSKKEPTDADVILTVGKVRK